MIILEVFSCLPICPLLQIPPQIPTQILIKSSQSALPVRGAHAFEVFLFWRNYHLPPTRRQLRQIVSSHQADAVDAGFFGDWLHSLQNLVDFQLIFLFQLQYLVKTFSIATFIISQQFINVNFGHYTLSLCAGCHFLKFLERFHYFPQPRRQNEKFWLQISTLTAILVVNRRCLVFT